MQKFENIADWVEKKYGSQAKAAKAMKTTQGVISQWISGRSVPKPDKQALMAKNDYDGPFPEPKKKGSTKLVGAVSREEFAEWRGYLKAGMEGVLKRLDDLEGQVRKLSQTAEKD